MLKDKFARKGMEAMDHRMIKALKVADQIYRDSKLNIG
jgi:hypothetical protein